MKYNFFVHERIIIVDDRLTNKVLNKTIKYKLKHIRSGIIIIISVNYNPKENEIDRLNVVKNKLKTFINTDDIHIYEETCIEEINII